MCIVLGVRALPSLMFLAVMVSLQSKLYEALTRTPLQNHLRELYSLLHFLEPGKFGTEEEFLEKYEDLNDSEKVRCVSRYACCSFCLVLFLTHLCW